MTADEFRELASNLPEVQEGEHMNHPDFRVGGKIFATLGPGGDWAMVHLPPESQASWVQAEPDVFEPFNGAWGRKGYTKVHLGSARVSSVRDALKTAWSKAAPAR